MGLLGRWFGHDDARVGAATQPAPWLNEPDEHVLAYDPGLLDDLLHEHRELLALYTHIGKLLRSGQHDAIGQALDAFGQQLRAHAQNESQHLYSYLAQAMPEDSHDAELLRKLRHEMNAIAHAATRFASRYRAAALADPEQRQAFTRDYAAVGKLLAQRIKREETGLFPLYLPH